MNPQVTGIAAESGYVVVENASLVGRNTFRVPARAELLIEVHRAETLAELFALPALREGNVLVLGEGSNILFTEDWPGVVLTLSASGIRIIEERGDGALVRVEAGETWHDLVGWSLGHSLAGLENLALIPGTVGAAPIQNIGAYGVEIAEFVECVHAYDRVQRAFVQLTNEECAFAYRDSRFKREPQRHVITQVDLLLPRSRELRLDYAGVREELAAMGVASPTTIMVAEAVCRLRTRKLPNPALIGNAGSFFKNPSVPLQFAENLRKEHPALAMWPASAEHRKLSAASLIEACGFRGLREGDAGVSSQHALVLVNHGHASGAEIWALAQRIRAAVAERFGVELEPEPLIVGA